MVEGVDASSVCGDERVEGRGLPGEVGERRRRVRERPVQEEEAGTGTGGERPADPRGGENGAAALEADESERRARRGETTLLPRAREEGERGPRRRAGHAEEEEDDGPRRPAADGRRERHLEDVCRARDGHRPVEREGAGRVAGDGDEAFGSSRLDRRGRPAGHGRRAAARLHARRPGEGEPLRREGARDERVRGRGSGGRAARRSAHDLPAGARRGVDPRRVHGPV